MNDLRYRHHTASNYAVGYYTICAQANVARYRGYCGTFSPVHNHWRGYYYNFYFIFC